MAPSVFAQTCSLLLASTALLAGSATGYPTLNERSPIESRSQSLRIPFAQSPSVSSSSYNRIKRQDRNLTDDEAYLLSWRDIRYIATVNLAGQDLDLVLDTGSTDTFVYSVQPLTTSSVPVSLRPPLFNNATAVNLTTLPNITYRASYGGTASGQLSTLGAIQLAPLSINGTGLSVRNQSFANLYYSSSPIGASGLLGLGFPISSPIWREVTDNYYNTTRRFLPLSQSQNYYPFVNMLYQQGSIPRQMFSLEVYPDPAAPIAQNTAVNYTYSRSAGYLTLGDYPEGTTEASFSFSQVPYLQINPAYVQAGYPNATGYRWTAVLEAIYFNDRRLNSTRLQASATIDGNRYLALIDSGNPTMILPSDVMSQITTAYAGNRLGSTIPCTSRFDLIFQFAGANYTLNRNETLVPSLAALDSLGLGGQAVTGCQFQAQAGSPIAGQNGALTSITYQLGDPFLRNVETVYDFGSTVNAALNPPRIGMRQAIRR